MEGQGKLTFPRVFWEILTQRLKVQFFPQKEQCRDQPLDVTLLQRAVCVDYPGQKKSSGLDNQFLKWH